MTAALLTALSSVALGLTLIGIYGLLSFSTSARNREIGLRVAIGANRRDVLRLVLAQGLAVICVGLLAGVLATLLVTRVVSTLLFGVEPFDAESLSWAALLILAASFIAAFLPCWRASQVDPAAVLRHD